MKGSDNEKIKTERLLQRITWISGLFALMIALLVILNFLQINSADPVNTKTIDALVERLNQDPVDEELRQQIREMDLLARKAYFTSRWQVRTGGYLILLAAAISIIAQQILIFNRKKRPELSDESEETFLGGQKVVRRWISIGGVFVVFIALFFAYLSHQSLEDKFIAASSPQPEILADVEESEQVEETPVQNDEPVSKDSAFIETAAEITVDTLPDAKSEKKQEIIVPEKDDIPEPKKENEITGTDVQDSFMNFRGPGANGIVKQKNLPVSWDGQSGKNIRWKVKIPLPGFNSPIIWGNRIFLTGAEENQREVYCFDRLSGELLWTYNVKNVPGSPAKSPEVANYTGYAAPTMATDGKLVFAIFSNGDLVGLDMDGNLSWAKNMGAPVNHYGYSSSLIVYEDKLIVQYDQKNVAKVVALNTASGEEAWSTKRDVKISWASPVIVNTGNRDELILAAEPYVISYNPSNGEELWRLDCIAGEVGPSVAYADGFVFSVNDYSKLAAIKLGDPPSVIWESVDYLSDIPSPVATEEYLILATSYGVIVCFDAKSGELLWEHEIDNSIYASPVISEDKVYLVDKQGITHIFKVDKTFVSIGTPELGEKIVCTPAFSNGRIYLRGYDHLYCIGE